MQMMNFCNKAKPLLTLFAITLCSLCAHSSPQIYEGMYTLISPDGKYNAPFNPVYSGYPDEHAYSFDYELQLDKLENVGFYIEFNQPTHSGYDAGYLVANDSEQMNFNEDGSFSYYCYTSKGGEKRPLFKFGDFDYIENATFMLTYDGYGQTLNVYGTGKYNSPDSGTDDISQSPLKIYLQNGAIEIEGKISDTSVYVYSIGGFCVYSGTDSSIMLHSGIYIVTIDGLTYKLTVK